jgi:hypothetical protein
LVSGACADEAVVDGAFNRPEAWFTQGIGASVADGQARLDFVNSCDSPGMSCAWTVPPANALGGPALHVRYRLDAAWPMQLSMLAHASDLAPLLTLEPTGSAFRDARLCVSPNISGETGILFVSANPPFVSAAPPIVCGAPLAEPVHAIIDSVRADIDPACPH